MPTSSASRESRPASFLRVGRLSAGYGSTTVVQDVSCEVGLGEVVSLLGPNGAGKSTLLKALVGMARVSAGSVHVADRAVTGMKADQLARIGVGYVPQLQDVFTPLTVLENLEMGGYLLRARELGPRIAEVMDVFPALKKMRSRQAAKLSGGERKMLAVARILMLRPRLLIIDEPTANLAEELAQALLEDHISGLASTGTAVLLVEQRVKAALNISHWAYVLVAGSIQVSGRPRDLSSRPDFAEIFLGARAPRTEPHGSP
jgi:branched-chain amino acid transport system ATP-binding protein